jgi:regulator of protease activity HflC (stomatin/prohibitin superfamily)
VNEETLTKGEKSLVGVIISIPVLILLFFILCFRTVGAGQVGIVTRFGEVHRTADSGVTVKLPWPVERLTKMNIQVQKEEQDSAAATSDLQDVNAKLALNYALEGSSALKVYKEIGKDYKNRVVIPAVQESFKAATAQYTASELLTKRAEVKGKAYEVIKSRLEKYGIRVVDLNVVNFSFSAEFTKAIEAKQVAQQQAQQAAFSVEKAENNAKATIAEARGRAEYQRIVQESLTPETLQRLALDKWDGKMPQVVSGGTGNIFGINLTR